MTVEQKREIIDSLREFTLRATKENATLEELVALPGVAGVLISIIPD
jgi:hypothetical protein